MASLARGGGGGTGPRLAGLLRRLQALDAASRDPVLPALAQRSLGSISASASAAAAAAAERAPAAAAPAADDNTTTSSPALVRLPTDLAGAVERFLGGGSSGSKRRSMTVGEALRRLGRSSKAATSSSSFAATTTTPTPTTTTLVRRTRSGRPRARDVAALEQVVAERGADELSERDLELFVFGAQGRGDRRRRGGVGGAASAAVETEHDGADASSSSSSAPVYDRADAEAYALARLAPSYAACRAAMAEVAARLSGGAPAPFAPRRLLDFGAGPGTAVWAAQDVWLTSNGAENEQQQQPVLLRAAHAVEPSAAMTSLGRRLEAARAAGLLAELERSRRRASALPEGFPRRPAAAPVTWAPSMAALRRRAAGGAGRRRYDLVTCSYVLSELGGGGDGAAAEAGVEADASNGHADRVVRALWDMVAEGGVLLLVEPGTPAGSAAVLRARALVLDVALRRAAKRDRRRVAGAGAAAGSAAADDNDDEPEGGAYVVAPCPHDGPCPMQRAAEMAAALEDGDGEEETQEEEEEDDDEGGAVTATAESRRWAGAWCHFGQRLQRPPFMQRYASRGAARRTDHQVERFSYVAIRRGRRPEPLPPGHVLRPAATTAAPSPPLFVARAEEQDKASLSSSSSDDDDDDDDDNDDGDDYDGEEEYDKDVVLDDQLLEAIDDMVPPSYARRGRDQEEEEEGDGADEDEGEGDDEDEEGAVLPVSMAAGPGLVDRLVALDAAGVEWWRPEALEELQQHHQGAADPQQRPVVVVAAAAAAAAASEAAPAAAPVPSTKDDEAFRRKREAQAALVAAARSGATGWARLVRPPLKRGGHVVVDLCCAASGAGGGAASSSSALRRPSPAPEGRLVRATVTRSSLSRAWGSGNAGPAAYALARTLRWGDAMPLPPPPKTARDE